jgi:hypothetical protein
MKSKTAKPSPNTIFFLIISLLLSSCTSYSFLHPQPVDRKNCYHFPKAFRGTWQPEEDTSSTDSDSVTILAAPSATTDSLARQALTTNSDSTIPFNFDTASARFTDLRDSTSNDNECSPITISRKFIEVIQVRKERVDKESVETIGPGNYDKLLSSDSDYWKQGDSVRREPDRTPKYLIRNDMIFEINEGRLGKGYQYDSSGKYIVIRAADTTMIDLGRNAFLRKLNKKLWVLNINGLALADEEAWWTIMILEKTGRSKLRVWDCDTSLKTHHTMFYHSGSAYYFDAKWSAAEMMTLFHDGYFSSDETWRRN